MSLRFPSRRWSAAWLAAAALAACSSPTDRSSTLVAPNAPLLAQAPSAPDIVISQIYGGGGNSGATYTNDFVELFNPGASPISLTGWSVQYASAAGNFTQVTALSGSIPSGGYFLVQESQGAGGTKALPTPDVNGTIAMSATAAKIVVARTATAFGIACPSGASVVDLVAYGSGTNCGTFTPTLSNTTAAFRKLGGCTYTGDPSADFTTGAPAPRNSASPLSPCPGTGPAGPLDHVVVAGANTVIVGNTTQLTATPQDATNRTVTTATVTWASSDPTIATVDATGNVTGVAVSQTPVTITATATDNGITKKGTLQLTVTALQINWIDVSSSSTALPPGFQTQLFATARTASGGTIINATFTFQSLDPSIATIATVENTGIVTGVSASATNPRLQITATPVGGGTPYQFTTTSIAIETPTFAPSSFYFTNDDFGNPTPANSSNPNDLLIVRPQYTISYNESRGTPNWVSYELDAPQMVAGQDRCNCFTADPLLPTAKQIFTSDYTDGGFDRGHMTRSADRTAGDVDNAITFYLTNVVPQTADLNEGVWAQFEDALADSAEAGRAVYIITGPLFSRSNALTFLKGEGKVAVPDSTWKIAVIGPDVGGIPFTHASIHTLADMAGISVIAVNMPNIAGVRNDPWQKYVTTIGKIETATGYNFLSALPEAVQCKIEVRDCLPQPTIVSASGSNTVAAGTQFTLNTSAADADGSDGPWKLSIDWGDGTTYATTLYALPTDLHPFARAKTWATPGQYTVRITITDKEGGQGVSTLLVTVTP